MMRASTRLGASIPILASSSVAPPVHLGAFLSRFVKLDPFKNMTQVNLNDAFLHAASTGDIDAIEKFFTQDPTPDLEFEDCFGQTALHLASSNGHHPVIKYLVWKGADILHADKEGRIAAHFYCRGTHDHDDPAVLKLLIGRDALTINKMATDHMTYLMLAVKSSKRNLVCCLLDRGADPSIRDQHGNTPWAQALWRLVSAVFQLRSFLAERESIIDTCRAFVLRDVISRDADDMACPVEQSIIRGTRVYRLEKPSVLFEQSMDKSFSEQTRRVIRQEFCTFVSTSTGLAYREPSCTFDHDHCGPHTIDRSELQRLPDEKPLIGVGEAISTINSCSSAVTDDGNILKSHLHREDLTGENHNSLSKSICGFSTSTPEFDSETRVDTEIAPPSSIEYLSLVVCLQPTQDEQRLMTCEQMPFIYPASSTNMVVRQISLKDSREGIGKKCKYCIGSDTDLHGFRGPLTLDEYCYPVLPADVLVCRNSDQVLGRLKNRSPWNRHLDSIMVDQAWVWQTQDALVYTTLDCTPQLKVASSKDACSNRYWETGVFLADLVDSAHLEGVFDMFQIAIVELAEEVGDYLKQTGVESIGIQDEKRFYHEIKDIREELSMLGRIISQQEEVWREFASNAWPEIWADSQAGRTTYPIVSPNSADKEHQRTLMRLVLRPKLRIQKFQRRISQLDEDAERVERSVTLQLDLKQKHASLQESHATAVMSTAVFGFTVVTIVFTPLSFVISLFALPIEPFQYSQIPSHWDGGGGMYSTRYIGMWTATAEIVTLAVTFAAMWLALEYGLKYPITRKTREFLNATYKRLANVTRDLVKRRGLGKRPRKETITQKTSHTIGHITNV